MSGILDDYPTARKTAYLVSTVTGLGLGATQVGYSAAAAGQPTWLTVALAVYAFLGASLGLTAASNVNTDPPTPPGWIDYNPEHAKSE